MNVALKVYVRAYEECPAGLAQAVVSNVLPPFLIASPCCLANAILQVRQQTDYARTEQVS